MADDELIGDRSIPPDVSGMSDVERQALAQVLTTEYGMLMGALSAAWSASLSRSSIFLAVVSAAGIALGFAAQGGVDQPAFGTLGLVILVVVAFLGVATFGRLVQVQRESIVYITGMNRIRHFFGELVPAAIPFYVLPRYDDEHSLYRSIGTGMSRLPPRRRLMYLIVQTQGIVGVVTGVVVGSIAGLALRDAEGMVPWLGALAAFGVTLTAMISYWLRSLRELQGSLRTLFPTPPDEVDALF